MSNAPCLHGILTTSLQGGAPSVMSVGLQSHYVTIVITTRKTLVIVVICAILAILGAPHCVHVGIQIPYMENPYVLFFIMDSSTFSQLILPWKVHSDLAISRSQAVIWMENHKILQAQISTRSNRELFEYLGTNRTLRYLRGVYRWQYIILNKHVFWMGFCFGSLTLSFSLMSVAASFGSQSGAFPID